MALKAYLVIFLKGYRFALLKMTISKITTLIEIDKPVAMQITRR